MSVFEVPKSTPTSLENFLNRLRNISLLSQLLSLAFQGGEQLGLVNQRRGLAAARLKLNVSFSFFRNDQPVRDTDQVGVGKLHAGGDVRPVIKQGADAPTGKLMVH